MIKTTDLTKSYGKARGVTDLTLHVPEGSCFGFIGPNGAGKSTTIRTILGPLPPTTHTLPRETGSTARLVTVA